MNQLSRFLQIAKSGSLISRAIRKAIKEGDDYKSQGKFINKVLTDLGPTFIKLGQMLALRPDIIPPALADELRGLLDNGETIDYSEVNKVFKGELGQSPGKIFDSFEKKPAAVASLAQVHKAKYKGKELAVKVQKPGIKKIIDQDLRLVRFFLNASFLNPKLKKAKKVLEAAMQEFFRWLDRELDYRLEAVNIARISESFKEVDYFIVPEVFPHFSSKKILTMEWTHGVSLNELFDEVKGLSGTKIVNYKKLKFKKSVLVDRLMRIVFKQVFEDGFFHADPHPANILVSPEGRVVYIDFGLIGVLDSRGKEGLLEVFTGIVKHDDKKIADAFLKMDRVGGHKSKKEMRKVIKNLLSEWQTGTLVEMSAAEIFYRLVNIALEYEIDLPLPFVIVGRTVLEYDGVFRKLEPHMDMIEAIRPLVEKEIGFSVLAEKFVPSTVKELLPEMKKLSPELASLASDLIKEGIELTANFGPQDKIIRKKLINLIK